MSKGRQSTKEKIKGRTEILGLGQHTISIKVLVKGGSMRR